MSEPNSTIICAQCGNSFDPAEMNFTWAFEGSRPEGICRHCDEVMNFYRMDMYSEDDDYAVMEEEYWYNHGTCETCGGEWGEGWTTCACWQAEHEEQPACSAPTWPYVVTLAAMAAAVCMGWRLR